MGNKIASSPALRSLHFIVWNREQTSNSSIDHWDQTRAGGNRVPGEYNAKGLPHLNIVREGFSEEGKVRVGQVVRGVGYTERKE